MIPNGNFLMVIPIETNKLNFWRDQLSDPIFVSNLFKGL